MDNQSKITFKLLTKQGERENNEDNLGMMEKDNTYCFAVADGLGGHDKGEVASELVINECMSFFYAHVNEDTVLQDAIMNSQKKLLELQDEEHAWGKMKTTIVAFVLKGDNARWAHVGDSRLYCFENKRLIKRTLDHSVPQMLASSGQIREKEIRHHADRNRLLRVMGTEWDEPRYELSEPLVLKPNKNYAFLMCTDGFWELITEKEMKKCLKKSQTVEEWILTMEKIVLENGVGTGMDNYTALGVFVERE